MNLKTIKTFYDLLKHKDQTEIRFIDIWGFVGQFVSNVEIFSKIEQLIKENNLIVYDGYIKCYKK